MREALLCAVNAIERAPEDADCGGLVEFCHEHGLHENVCLTLVQMEGDTDAGRLGQALAALEKAQGEDGDDGEAVHAWLEANTPTDDAADEDESDDDGDSGEGSTEATDTGSDDVQES